MVSLFLSHSSRDRNVVDDILRRLRAEGFEAIFLSYDPEHGIPAGRKWEPELYSALQRSDAVLFVGTESSVNSRWCFAELALARSAGKPVFPVRISEGVTQPLLGDIQWVDVPAEGESAYARLWAALKDRGFDSADSFDWDPRRPPYPGLAAYRSEDAAVFFGRSDIVNGLLGQMNATLRPQGHPFLAVVGPSGCGKSSIIRAGLVPRLLRLKADWVVVDPFTPGSSPVSALARSLAAALSGSAGDRAAIARRLHEDPSDLPELIRDLVTARPDHPGSVLLVVDQAEQLLRREEAGGPTVAEAREFVRLLQQSPQQDPAVWVVCTLRSEFLGVAAHDSELVALARNPVVVGPLERARLPEVIEGPAQRAGLRFDPGLVQRMVEETRGGDALPLLGYALQQLHQKRRPDGLITTASYDAIGGVEGALRQRADEALEALQAAGHADAFLPTLLRLVAIDERDEPLGRAVAITSFGPPQREVIDAFVDARLLVSGGGSDSATVQVAHETLFRAWPPLREAIAASRDALRVQTELEGLARDWETADRRDSYLLRGDRLQQAEAWAVGHGAEIIPGSGLTEFLARSRARDTAALQRESELVARRVLLKLDEDPERAILLALAAIEEYAPTPDAIRALDTAVRASRVRAWLTGHDGGVNSVAYAPDGSRLVTASDDGTARIWSRSERNEILVLRGHSARVRCAGYSPDGMRIVTASDDETIVVWDAESGGIVFSAKEDDRVYWATWSPDGKRIAAVSGLNGYLTLRDTRTGALVTAGGDRPNRISVAADSNDRFSVTFAPDGTRLATGRMFGESELWRLRRSRVLTAVSRFPDYGKGIHSVAFSPDGARVLAGTAEGSARVWDVAAGEQRLEIKTEAGPVNSVRYSADGSLILTAGYDKASVWKAVDGTPVFSLAGHHTYVLSAALSPGEEEIATAGRDGNIRLWSAAEKPDSLPIRHESRVFSGCFSPDGARILTAAGHTANIFSAADQSHILTLSGHTDDVNCVAFSPDGSMVATSSFDYTACLWDAADGRQIGCFTQHSSPVQNVAFSADGSWLITCAGGKGIGDYIYGNLKVWDLQTGQEILCLWAEEDINVLSARFSPDGTRIAVALSMPDVQIWEAANNGARQSLSGHAKTVYYAEFSPDGSRVVSASADGTARVWDAADGRELHVLSGHGDAVTWAAFSRDGTRIVTSSLAGTAMVWDAATGKQLAGLRHGGAVSMAVFSPDGSRILTTGLDDVAWIWPHYRADDLVALARTRAFRTLTDAERQEYGLPDRGPGRPGDLSRTGPVPAVP
jgi:WD40 repeat protein